MDENARTIKQFLGLSEGGEEVPYSLVELLALDAPTYEILHNGQSLLVPKIVHDFHMAEKNDATLDRFLGYFGLNRGVYDEEHNPHGVLARSGKTSQNYRKLCEALVLDLLGVSNENKIGFFSKNMILQDSIGPLISDAFIRQRQEVNRSRKLLPLQQSALFPRIDRFLKQIERQTGLKPEEIFKSDAIPPLHTAVATRRAKRFGLDMHLQFFALATTGNYTRKNLASRLGMSTHTVTKWAQYKQGESPFSEKARAVLK